MKIMLPIVLLLLVALGSWYYSGDLSALFHGSNARQAAGPASTVQQSDNTAYLASHRPAANDSSGFTLPSRSGAGTDLILRQVFPATDQEAASAIIQYKDTDADLFSTGQRVFNLAMLDEIHPDYVLLSENGQTIRLPLKPLPADELETATDRNTPTFPAIDYAPGKSYKDYSVAELAHMAAAVMKHPAPGEKARPVAQHKNLVYASRLKALLEKAKRDSLKRNSASAWAMLDFQPEIELDQITGLRLAGSEDSEFLSRYGLEQGDVITSVNGTNLDSRVTANQAINVIGQSKTLELVIQRDGETRTLNITK